MKMTKEETAAYLMDVLSYAYCDNCRHEDTDDEDCEWCHRKYMAWGIRKETADAIADRLCG